MHDDTVCREEEALKLRSAKPAWRESLESIIVAVTIALLLRSFVVEAFKIPSGSMIPTLSIGDQIFVNKFIYGIRVPFTQLRIVDFDPPERGDVIVFVCPVEPHDDYIKRVVGLSGDIIKVRDGTAYINDVPLRQQRGAVVPYWDRDAEGGDWRRKSAIALQENNGERDYTVLQENHQLRRAPDFGPYQVPKDHVFVMGDNRDHSYDSRSWGPVPIDSILGKSLFVWWSWGNDGLATDRLGQWID